MEALVVQVVVEPAHLTPISIPFLGIPQTWVLDLPLALSLAHIE